PRRRKVLDTGEFLTSWGRSAPRFRTTLRPLSGNDLGSPASGRPRPSWHHGRVPSKRPSRRRPWGEPHRELDLDRATGGRSTTQRRGEDWTVQKIRASDKAYRCPGCQQEIGPGTAH